jgi:hypothetical protein
MYRLFNPSKFRIVPEKDISGLKPFYSVPVKERICGEEVSRWRRGNNIFVCVFSGGGRVRYVHVWVVKRISVYPSC